MRRYVASSRLAARGKGRPVDRSDNARSLVRLINVANSCGAQPSVAFASDFASCWLAKSGSPATKRRRLYGKQLFVLQNGDCNFKTARKETLVFPTKAVPSTSAPASE